MRRLALKTTVVFATLLVFYVAWQFRLVVALFVMAMALSAAVAPLITRGVQLGIPRPLMVVATYLVGLTLTVSLLILPSIFFVRDVDLASEDFLRIYQILEEGERLSGPVAEYLAENLPPFERFSERVANMPLGTLLGNGLGMSLSFFNLLINAIVVITLAIYWSLSRAYFERLWLSQLAAGRRQRVREAWHDTEEQVGTYVRSTIAQAILAGTLIGLGFSFVGIPYPAALGFCAAIAWLIPWFGAALVVAIVWITMLPTAIDISTAAAVAMGTFATIYAFAILLFLKFVVEPRLLLGRSYSSLLMLVVVFAMADAVGIVGLILGPAIAVGAEVILWHWLVGGERIVSDEVPEPTLDQLQAEYARLIAQIEDEQELSPPVRNMLGRLEELLAEAEDIVPVAAQVAGMGTPVSTKEG